MIFKNVYKVNYYKWAPGVVGDPSWPYHEMCWSLVKEEKAESLDDLPKLGDMVERLPITEISINKKNVEIFLGDKVERSVDAFYAKRDYYLSEIRKGNMPTQQEMAQYQL